LQERADAAEFIAAFTSDQLATGSLFADEPRLMLMGIICSSHLPRGKNRTH
jgi:hypothetical protein